MRTIPAKMKKEMSADPYYKDCARKCDGGCNGRITWEHAIIYAGRQVNEKWAIIPLCEYHHAVNMHQDVGDLNKELNICLALNRATENDLRSISKAIDYTRLKARLNRVYGTVPSVRMSVLFNNQEEINV